MERGGAADEGRVYREQARASARQGSSAFVPMEPHSAASCCQRQWPPLRGSHARLHKGVRNGQQRGRLGALALPHGLHLHIACSWDSQKGDGSITAWRPGRQQRRPLTGGHQLPGRTRERAAVPCVVKQMTGAGAAKANRPTELVLEHCQQRSHDALIFLQRYKGARVPAPGLFRCCLAYVTWVVLGRPCSCQSATRK